MRMRVLYASCELTMPNVLCLLNSYGTNGCNAHEHLSTTVTRYAVEGCLFATFLGPKNLPSGTIRT